MWVTFCKGFGRTLAMLVILGLVLASAASAQVPTVSSVSLSSASGQNNINDDLTTTFTLGGSATRSSTAWFRNGTPLATLYLPFEGGAAAALQDRSGNGLVTTSVGTTTWSATSGHSSTGGMSFTGTNYLMAGNTFPTNSSYTKTAWVYRTVTRVNHWFLASGTTAVTSHAFGFTQEDRLRAGHNGSWNLVESKNRWSIATNTWYFVALTFDYASGQMILYKDGVPEDTAILTGTLKNVSDPSLAVGSYRGTGNYTGSIDDVEIFNIALSPEQIANMYSAGPNQIKNQENNVGDIWQSKVTPYSTTAAGTEVASNSLTIIATSPSFTSTPVTTGIAGKPYSYNADADGGPHPTFTFTTSPFGMTIDPVSGLVSWTPSSAGTYPVTITATNTQGTADQSFNVVVANPTVSITSLQLQSIGLGDLQANYSLGLSATTAGTAWFKNGNPIMILYMPFEGGASYSLENYAGNGGIGYKVGNPVYLPNGGHDGNGAYQFDGTSYISMGDIFPVRASYTKCAWIYHTTTGVFNHILSGWDHNTTATGGHGMRVAFDQRLSAGQNGDWRIVQTAPNAILSNHWYFAAVTFNYSTGEMVLYLDGSPVDTAILAANMRDVTDPGLLVGATQGSFAWNGMLDDARVYNYPLSPQQIAMIYATGGDKIAANETVAGETWQAKVTAFSSTEASVPFASNTLVVGVSDQPPVLAAIGAKSVDENQPLNFNVSATDPEAEIPTLTASPLPSGATFVDNGNGTGSFSFTPTYAQAGVYQVTFTASDGTNTDDEIVTITVNNVNRDPIIATTVDPQTVLEGVILAVNYSASDPDSDPLTLTASTDATGAISFTDNGNGTGQWVWTPAVGQAGVYSVTLRAFDNSGAGDSITFSVTVVSTLPPSNWTATIHSEGAIAGSSTHSADVIIGMGNSDQTTPSAPFPPEYTTSLRLWKGGVDGPFYRDIQQSGGLCYYWVIELDPHGNVAPSETPRCATLSWSAAQLSDKRNYRLIEGTSPSGTIVVADMRTTTSYQVCDLQTSKYYTIQWFDDDCAGMSFANLVLNAGWNLISLPVTPETPTVSAVFPTAQAVFEFNGQYQEPTTLVGGKGYWVKVPQATVVMLSGISVSDVSGPLSAGWNLVGSPNCTVTPTTTPSGNITAIFGYNGVYQPTTTLSANSGYWINSTAASTLNAFCGMSAPSIENQPLAMVAGNAGIITIHAEGEAIDGANQANIVIGTDSRSQMLPQPPSMPQYSVALSIFDQVAQKRLYQDVRDDISVTNRWTIAVNPKGNSGGSSNSTATLTWDAATLGQAKFELREGKNADGKLLIADMSKQTSLQVTGGNEDIYFTITRAAGKGTLPGGFALGQNYPNPFNPTTQIQFSLPSAGQVRMEIFNVLGQQVKTLVDQAMEAGEHTVSWDATDNSGQAVSSGIYFYRMVTDDHTDRKKMLLLR
jgi:hypothetical protein